ncbi:Protein prenyltransferase alpha subunit repeat-containing protein 1 [Oryzias melastigma]|uniref:Protein prenyltransferase alpha subunit repeat-containing protein 1 n=1 Tax=Oryzias melastigma TaxID=30732 RepID=A0A834L0W0_ORYME|nr:Protein prenyltransferase alpha subunit repeat-containing protein 1 [Oryzias melastigma]
MSGTGSEVDVLVQRVVRDLSTALNRNRNIDEIGLIPCPEARYNRSPIVMVENKLGVESWCVKFLLPYVHNKLLLYRQRRLWLDRQALVDITCTLLLLNPDLTTAWNVRKELVESGALSPERDLYLGKLALSKSPKSPETWIHRRWVLLHLLQKAPPADQNQTDAERSRHLSEQLAQTLHEEMKVCADAACRYPSNYNAWSHRIWVLQRLAKGNVKVFLDELASMRPWVSTHVSDHSGFHYRQFLLQELTGSLGPPAGCCANGERSEGEEPQRDLPTVLQLFCREMELCSDLIQSFPGHETLWSHRRHVFFLWHRWKEQHRDDSGDEGGDPAGGAQTPVSHGDSQTSAGVPMEVDRGCSSDPQDVKRLRRGVPVPHPPSSQTERVFVSSLLDGCGPEQRSFALAYRKWLDTVVGVPS